ncbi:hypothetical protein QQ045_026218 [Rhodiola kirilowii]
MEHDKTGCQAPPDAPQLCANNCGFFGSAATNNMCSKCFKEMVLNQQQAQIAVSSLEECVLLVYVSFKLKRWYSSLLLGIYVPGVKLCKAKF